MRLDLADELERLIHEGEADAHPKVEDPFDDLADVHTIFTPEYVLDTHVVAPDPSVGSSGDAVAPPPVIHMPQYVFWIERKTCLLAYIIICQTLGHDVRSRGTVQNVHSKLFVGR